MTNMGRSTKGPITPYAGSWADQEFKRRRAAALLIGDDQSIEDAISLATMREQVRTFGFDRIRGL
jgi:hypothetical protein